MTSIKRKSSDLDTTDLLVILTFVGMIGIYVGAYLAYKKYQTYTAPGSSGASLLNLVGSLMPSNTSNG